MSQQLRGRSSPLPDRAVRECRKQLFEIKGCSSTRAEHGTLIKGRSHELTCVLKGEPRYVRFQPAPPVIEGYLRLCLDQRLPRQDGMLDPRLRRLVNEADLGPVGVGQPVEFGFDLDQIGRASCRERGEISVV